MSRVFLSHSSKDKGFVRPIAELIGFDNCIFDEATFESSSKNIKEIFDSLDKTDIFVYFISNESLNSDWVKLELNNAKEKLNDTQISQIYPIIIDSSIKYTDIRIPNFLKQGFGSYNLRHIVSYKVAYKKIKNQQICLRMNNDFKYEEKKNIFYGRDSEIKLFKERYDDSSRKPMKCLVVSGIDRIGRGTYAREVLKSAKIIKPYYFPSSISLNSTENIDDVIIKISDLGFGDFTLEDLVKINSIDSKIELLTMLLEEAQKYNEHIFIYDNMCLVNLDQNVQYWLENALKKIKNKIVVTIITSVKLDYIRYKKNDDIFFVEISELTKSERAGLLRIYSDLEEVEFDRDDIEFLQQSLTGYPPQITYCVDLAKEYNVEYLRDHPDKLVEYSFSKASKVLDAVIDKKHKEISYGLLAFLSEYDTVPVKFIYDICKINAAYTDVLQRFIKLTICRYIGAANEYIKVNSVIQDYIQRNRFDLPKDINKYLKDNIDEFNNKINDKEYTHFMDFSELNYYLKEKLKTEQKLPNRFLYSTVFVRTVFELYNNQKNDKVISIINNLKQNGDFQIFDDVPKSQLQYYYCLSLARNQLKEFTEEVEYFRDEFNYNRYNFLKGFNYRISGNLEYAENCFKNVLKKNGNYYKAKRELVTVYRLLDEFDTAYDIAKDNFINSPDNPYQMQAYFECLMRKSHLTEQEQRDVQNIIDNITKISSGRKSEMYYQILGLYFAYNKNDSAKAIETLKKGLELFSTNIYLAKDLFDVSEKDHNIHEMKNAIDILDKLISDGRSGHKNIVQTRRAILNAYLGKSKAAIEVELCREKTISERSREKILKKIANIISVKS